MYRSGALLAQYQRHLVTRIELKNDAFQVQKDINDILAQTIDRGVLMHDTRNLYLGRRKSVHR